MVRRAAELLGQAAAGLVEIPGHLGGSRWENAFAVMTYCERYMLQGKEILECAKHADLLTDVTRGRFDFGRGQSGADYAAASLVRLQAISEFDRTFDQADLLVGPTVGYPAITVPDADIDRPMGISAHTYLANFIGAPAISVPVGTVDGLPIGIQIIGRPGADRLVLAAAQTVETLLPHWASGAVANPVSLTGNEH